MKLLLVLLLLLLLMLQRVVACCRRGHLGLGNGSLQCLVVARQRLGHRARSVRLHLIHTHISNTQTFYFILFSFFFVLKYLRVSRAGRFVAGVVGCCSRRIAAATKWTLCSCRRSLYIFFSKRDKMKKWKQSITVNKAKALFCMS